MTVAGGEGRRSYLERQLSTLALCRVKAPSGMALLRVAGWHNGLVRLGVPLPLFVVHDLGLLLTGVGSGAIRRLAESPGSAWERGELAGYTRLLEQVAESELCERGAGWRLRDDLVAVLLSKLLRAVQSRWPARRSWVKSELLPLDPGALARAAGQETSAYDLGPIHSLVVHLVEHRLYVLTALEQIDLDTLRLLSLFQHQGGGAVLDLADLLNVFSSPEANGVVNFSMELLPSVLETRRPTGVQTLAMDGYASLERRGSVDSVVMSELAYDDDIFEQKLADHELYYYGHEKQRTEERQLHYLLVDSSASMRGEREIFARGVALTLIKKLTLQGHEVCFRFFDSRLYEAVRVVGGGEAAVPHLLCFRSERGRNYARVFRQLVGELRRLRRQDRRTVVLYLLTHGQCHVGVELIEELAAAAFLYGVFILPSSPLHLEYLPSLHRYQIVEAETLRSRSSSVDRARQIVDDASDALAGSAAARAGAEG